MSVSSGLPSARELVALAGFLWDASSGYRLRPSRSPYLRWRIETFWGTPAEEIDRSGFWRFLWSEKGRLGVFMLWAGRLRARKR